MLRDNYYDILGVPCTANLQDIRKAYTTLVLQYHPDKNESEDARDKFEAIQRAYETLSDENKRSSYNALLRRQAGLYCPKSTATARQSSAERDNGGTIITGDGWSFAINLNNVSVSKLVFTFAEDGDTDDPQIEHIVVKTKPSSPDPPGTSGTKRRQTVFDIPVRASRQGDRNAGEQAARDARSSVNVPPRNSSGRKQTADDSRLSSPESRAANRGPNRGNIASINVDTHNPNVNGKRRKGHGDRKRNKARQMPNVPSKGHVESCPRNRPSPTTNLKNTFARTDLNPVKMNIKPPGNFAFPPRVTVGSKTNIITSTRTPKPKLLATRTIIGKVGSDRNVLGLFPRKSSNFSVRPTLFAVRSRLLGPIVSPQSKPDIENKPKRKVVSETKKKLRKNNQT